MSVVIRVTLCILVSLSLASVSFAGETCKAADEKSCAAHKGCSWNKTDKTCGPAAPTKADAKKVKKVAKPAPSKKKEAAPVEDDTSMPDVDGTDVGDDTGDI